MDKNTIRNNFSKNAATYDDHARVQKVCAERLINLLQVQKNNFSRILETGCGTGGYTAILRAMYPKASIIASDISKEMIKIAQTKCGRMSIIFKTADSDEYWRDKKFDLITSNAAFQWFSSFDRALKNCAGLLAPEGTLCFSMYGPGTFIELQKVFLYHFGRRSLLSSSSFLPYEKVKNRLRRHFANFELTEEHFTVDFSSFWDFLRNIKYSGGRGEGLPADIFIGKDKIKEMERTYMKKFGRIVATHHVFFCKARRGNLISYD